MKIRLDENNIKWGFTAFIVVICSMLAFFFLLKFSTVMSALGTVRGILSPFIWGFVIAYLLCPIYNWTVRHVYAICHDKASTNRRALVIGKVCGTVISIALLLLVITSVSWMILPGLYDSIINIIDMLPSGTENLISWVDARLSKVPFVQARVEDYINNSSDKLIDFATTTFLPHYTSLAAGISSSIIGAVNALKNIVIGIIVSVYFLNSKDIFSAQLKKILFALFSEKRAVAILDLGEFSNNAFGGFINGKIIDSAIIGIICFVCMSIFGWDYSLLISCIVGITNIIPFFGPFIGAIPSVLLLLMVNSMHALYFAIYILILQQFDGNILGPKILGDRTGVASFWVLFSVIVGGGLLGVVGMIISIPIFAIVYYYGTQVINAKLAKKGFSTSLADYKIDSYRSTNVSRKETKGIAKTIRALKHKKNNKDKEDND